MRVNEGCAVRQNTQNKLLWNAQHLCNLNTLTDKIRWLVTSIRRYANTLGYRLMTSTTTHTPERVINVNGTNIMQDILVIADLILLAHRHNSA